MGKDYQFNTYYSGIALCRIGTCIFSFQLSGYRQKYPGGISRKLGRCFSQQYLVEFENRNNHLLHNPILHVLAPQKTQLNNLIYYIRSKDYNLNEANIIN